MRMAVGRLPAGHDPCHNHPVILQSCMVTEVAIVPIQVGCPKNRLRSLSGSFVEADIGAPDREASYGWQQLCPERAVD